MFIQRKYLLLGIVALTVGAYLLTLFGHYKSDIIGAIQDIAIHMRKQKYSPVLMATLVTVTGIPPILGFTFAVTMTGFIYGFPYGCLPATLGAFLSAIFTCGKLNCARWIKLSEKRQDMYQAMQDAITQGGFKMILLIRICPLPWQLTNLILSLVPTVTWRSYVISAFIACFKFNLDIWVGSQLANLSDPDLPPETHRVTLMYMSFGVVVLILSGVWIYKLTMLKIKEQQEKLRASQEECQSLLVNTLPSKN
ncbi:hypothetical protein INT47_005426 [Mucor saturninus]|uniref:Golgi apparatus membrane protein TVP38 n=1 Tax=Mucor saturninus TaxID=64648 RepID=A0A8H7UU68_9FUNG|nr:hypothetical protein INT47_005426 [Mucor saturninus]